MASTLIEKLLDTPKNKSITITERSSTITPELVDRQVRVHNGKEYKKLEIKNEHIGLKIGELVATKKVAKYQKGSKKK